MTCFEIVIAIVNIIAVIAAPIVAVKVGQYLQERAQIRKDKMDIFKTLMENRTGWSAASVYAMNIIDVVFADDMFVRNCWKTYYEKLCIQNPYIPIGMVNTVQQQQMIQGGQALLADFMPSVLSRMMGGSIPQDQVKTQEGKSDSHA